MPLGRRDHRVRYGALSERARALGGVAFQAASQLGLSQEMPDGQRFASGQPNGARFWKTRELGAVVRISEGPVESRRRDEEPFFGDPLRRRDDLPPRQSPVSAMKLVQTSGRSPARRPRDPRPVRHRESPTPSIEKEIAMRRGWPDLAKVERLNLTFHAQHREAAAAQVACLG